MSSADRLTRVIAASIILALFLSGMLAGSGSIVILLVFAVMLLLTSIIGFSPLYCALGITSLRVRRINRYHRYPRHSPGHRLGLH